MSMSITAISFTKVCLYNLNNLAKMKIVILISSTISDASPVPQRSFDGE